LSSSDFKKLSLSDLMVAFTKLPKVLEGRVGVQSATIEMTLPEDVGNQ
jgi:hypothetical protein